MIDVHSEFKSWYDRLHHHDSACHRPWTIQAAIATAAHESFDDSERVNDWSLGLFPYDDPHRSEHKIGAMIDYAVHAPLAITKIVRLIDANHVRTNLELFLVSSILLTIFDSSHDTNHIPFINRSSFYHF